ncbi:EAL domain-containing protein [Sphingorhabdus sp. IMCC26285]|uniref:EAL domain-containing protein n=1 Tax=Sphingorhabdus profundilacus TaxID=2509718 RepID=A0A6I4M363_9SPHN|nr:EAL domain-containing protein [Sphingorhabdus profundilacus]MVZ96908.1 EAL domain-containing protein [Sphingorhabdus profundilacus]
MLARIVIVDDRSTNLRVYAQYVAMMGPEYSATCFHSAVEALKWLETEHADLLIVDYRMPEMDGAAFISKFRARTVGAHIPAIIITARQDRECRISALDAGATDFLQSPVSHVEFRDRAILLLGQFQKQQELKQSLALNNRTVPGEDDGIEPTGKSMLEQIIDTTPILINATDRNGKFLFLNSYQAALFGRDPEELVGHPITEILPPEVVEREQRRNNVILETGISIPNYEEKFVSEDIELTFHCNKSPLLNKDNQTIGILTTGLDITARKFAEEHRTHLALHDMLTGLPNRTLLSERMRITIDDCNATGKGAALLLLDLDRFKVINDTRGHQAGDMLLRQVAERLSGALDKNGFAARIGGDEFAIVMQNLESQDQLVASCSKLLTQIGEPYSVGGVEQLIGASIGIALIPDDGNSSDELLRLADLAMYEAKSSGRNRFCFFSPRMNQIAQLNAGVESDLRDALNHEQLFLEYQPIVDIGTGNYVGLEALLRWQHPVRGRLVPHDFIRVANDSGLIGNIGQWVINKACRQISAFADEGIILPPVAVNVSPKQFQYSNMSADILENIATYNIPTGRLAIEITEELLLEHNQEVRDQLMKLRSSGVGISIDDFGTGYSSLQYLRDLPATRLKIDQTFIARIENSSADRAIISTIAHLAHALNMRVVAEGVENEAQFALLRASGCDEAQGFLLGRPLAVNELRNLFTGLAPKVETGAP